MTKSDSITELLKALSAAQGKFPAFKKDSINESFTSNYADLATVISATKGTLAENGLSISQMPGSDKDGTYVETMLGHQSGEWMMSRLQIQVDQRDAHGIGSAISYARRYALLAMLGVAAEDDDGNEAARGAKAQQQPKGERQPKVIEGEWKGVTLKFVKEDSDNGCIWSWFEASNNLPIFTRDQELAKKAKALAESMCDVRFSLIRGKHRLLSIEYIQQ